MMLMVASNYGGCALVRWGRSGPNSLSSSMTASISLRIPADSIILGGCGLGSRSRASVRRSRDLFRFNQGPLVGGVVALNRPQTALDLLPLSWTPSSRERKTNLDLPVDAYAEVDIHEVKLGKWRDLVIW